MRHFLKTLLLVVLFCISNNILTASDYFIQNDLEHAKQRAKQEGKLIFVDFWAEWCNPCQWMDEQTFTNPKMKEYLTTNYIPVRIDIDNFQGYNYKEKYSIRYLPTILILNENGDLIKKFEESFAPSKLQIILEEHNMGNQNKQYYANYAAYSSTDVTISAPSQPAKPAPNFQAALSTDYMDGSAVVSSNSANTPTTRTSSSEPITYNTTTNSTAATATTNSYQAPSRADNVVANTSANTNSGYINIGLYQFNVHPAPTNGYSIQIGAYYEYGNVLSEVEKLQDQFIEVIYVHISELDGVPCYKVLLGHYGTRIRADQQKMAFKGKGMDCFVKDLATMGQSLEDTYSQNTGSIGSR